jgi:hypothetical protein
MLKHPKILYKYLDLEGSRAFLAKPQLRFKDFRRLDDLMEVLPGHRTLSEEEIAKYAPIKAQQLGNAISVAKCAHFLRSLSGVGGAYLEDGMRELLLAQSATLYICSMTERWDSGAMWGPYAEHHKGIVFGLSSAIDRICRLDRTYLTDIKYSDERPQMPFPVIDRKVIKEAIRTKSTDWSYQKEWRLVSDSDADELLNAADVAEVIIGYESRKDVELTGPAASLRKTGTEVFVAYPDPQLHRMARRVL